MAVLERTYHSLALEDPESKWELYDGQPRSKPEMSAEHNEIMVNLGIQLGTQLDRSRFRVRINSSRVRHSEHNYYVPDVFVVPADAVVAQTGEPGGLEYFDEPLPLVVEVWSPSTGAYDVERKFPLYKARRDHEIWRIHPYDRCLTRWVLQEDGTYHESSHFEGTIEPVALPTVRVDLDGLFAFG